MRIQDKETVLAAHLVCGMVLGVILAIGHGLIYLFAEINPWTHAALNCFTSAAFLSAWIAYKKMQKMVPPFAFSRSQHISFYWANAMSSILFFISAILNLYNYYPH